MAVATRNILGCLVVLGMATLAHGQQLLNVTPRAFFTVPAVQRELKLTPDQAARAEGLAKLLWERVGQASKELRAAGTTEEARRRYKEKLRDLEKDYGKDLADVLAAAQMKRLREINLQRRGSLAFTDTELQSALKLGDDQKLKLEALARTRVELLRDLMQLRKQGLESSRSLQTKSADIESQDASNILRVLDASQRKAWNALVGEPFRGE